MSGAGVGELGTCCVDCGHEEMIGAGLSVMVSAFAALLPVTRFRDFGGGLSATSATVADADRARTPRGATARRVLVLPRVVDDMAHTTVASRWQKNK